MPQKHRTLCGVDCLLISNADDCLIDRCQPLVIELCAQFMQPGPFAELLDILVEASASYSIRQFQAGVDAVQIFDS